MTKRPLAVLAALLTLAAPAAAQQGQGLDAVRIEAMIEAAEELPQLHALVVARDGAVLVEERFSGPALDQAVNIKSASKTIVAALVGEAIARGLIEGVDQPIVELLPEDDLPNDPDPRLAEVTVGNLLSMQAGLERTSGQNYGRWVASGNWVRAALARPFVDEPGDGMLYSTGNSHILSAILTGVSGMNTRDLLTEWLAEPLGFRVGAWDRDPQGIYFGGNQLALSPMALLAFGEMARNRGRYDGRQVLSAEWIADSWVQRTRSIHSGDGYGYGWFITEMRGHPVYYAWGYGGQMLYVVPDLALTVVMTSDETQASGRSGYIDQLHRLVADGIIPAAEAQS
jgi:CubicO group peptidase (beta-lactamase class C family)